MNITDQNLVIMHYAKGKEAALIEQYILDGPTELQAKLGVSDEEWEVIFDYLVFDFNLLYKCVVHATDFFVDAYVKHGMAHVREILDVLDDKYERALAVIFDYLVISKEGLVYHVFHHRDRYVAALKKHGSEFVRRVLGIYADKYNEHWGKVLDVLLKATCENIVSERTLDEGMIAFAKIFNVQRSQRRIIK